MSTALTMHPVFLQRQQGATTGEDGVTVRLMTFKLLQLE